MPRYLGYRDVWENCYYSTFGREAAMRYAERIYCDCGKRRYLHNSAEVQEGHIGNDWHKYNGLHRVNTTGQNRMGKSGKTRKRA
ncbi:MAG: hypothetical protein ACM3PE_08665 [Deltaproteobacteria bacterium]